MINANTQISDKALNRAAMIRLYERRLNDKVALVIDGHEVRVEQLIKEAKASTQGFNKLKEVLDNEMWKTHKEVVSTSKRGLLDLVTDQLSYTYQNIETAMGDIWRTQRPQGRIAEDIVLNKPLYADKTLEAGWLSVNVSERKRLEAIIRKGIADGSSLDEIALAVRKNNIHNITRNQSKALVVTAITSVTAQTDHAIYKANAKAINGWQYVAVLDSRTTPLCSHRDGKIYPIGDTEHLPPAHFHCRSTTVPVFKSWQDIARLEGVAAVRKRNFSKLTKDQQAFYDGQTPLKESYHDWLSRQDSATQLKHLGEYNKVELFRSGQLHLDKFTNAEGNSIGIKELRAMTDSEYTHSADTRRFAIAKEKLDALHLGASSPDDFISDVDLTKRLKDYYLLQSKELDGTLSLTNYRGALLHTKKATKDRVINILPTEDQLVFNPITGKYDDIRFYQPNISVYDGAIRRINDSTELLDKDKTFINKFVADLDGHMGINERSVIAENLRIIFSRYRKDPSPWVNFKAVAQNQIKFDVMNISDNIETTIRADTDVLKKLAQENFIDPILGHVQLQELHDNFVDNIIKRNRWEDSVEPKIARNLRDIFDKQLPPAIWMRLTERDLQQFYLKFAHRLSLADMPDRDTFAVKLGRDLYNIANINGDRNEWLALGNKLLNTNNKFFTIETFGVQKRRMKSKLGGHYFGPYYDTVSYNIRILDPRIIEYAQLNRKIDIGLRIPTSEPNRLFFKPGRKTYFVKSPIMGDIDTRIPITSTSSFSEFPDEFIDQDLVDALNWASSAEYKVDEDYYDFITKLMNFKDDKGKAAYFDSLNEYKHYITSRGDTYERFKAMDWLRSNNKSFSNYAFIDHRARVYERGFIGPQAGETFRPFLNTKESKNLGVQGFYNFRDQLGSFLGGLSDKLEGRYNSLTFSGRQKVAEHWWKETVKIGNHMIRGKPDDIRKILESEIVGEIEGEELGKFYRLAIEAAKIDNYLRKEPERIFHVSLDPNLEDIQIKPRLPQHLGMDVGFENNKIPRFSVSNNLQGAVGAIPHHKLKGQKIYIYEPQGDYTLITPTKIQVPDAEITGEKWITSETTLKKVGYLELSEEDFLLGEEKLDFKVLFDRPHSLKMGWAYLKNFHVYANKIKTISLNEGNIYSKNNLLRLNNYKTSLALEQDASSSGAQIIALTTKNKQLAELSNVIPTTQKKRLYDEIAAATFNDPRFREMNQKFGLTEKDLRKAAKAQNMVTFYGAGERTGIMNVEGKLAKILGKDTNTLVVKAAERDAVLSEISARIARYEKFDPETAKELQILRNNVRDIFNKGKNPGDDIMEELYFLDSKTKDFVEKLTSNYEKVVTPDDFKAIAKIMSEHLGEQVPILKSFTRYFGRLAEEYLTHAKPSEANFDWKSIINTSILGKEQKGYKLPDTIISRKGVTLTPSLYEFLGLKANEAISEKIIKRFTGWDPNGTLYKLIYGIPSNEYRKTGAKYLGFDIKYPTLDLKGGKTQIIPEIELMYANQMPKSWTNVPWVNFDGKIIEQNFTQSFEQRLTYKDKDGNWMNNIIMVDQKTDASWWDQIVNASGKINDIADSGKARTAYAVNGNHSNDATLVKQFHLWGKKNNIQTSTVHDAFFTNIADMLEGRRALRQIYANAATKNVIKNTLDEMLARGLPKEVYDKYLNEAIETGLIPVVGRSRIDGKLLKDTDILMRKDILEEIPEDFFKDRGFYGVG